MSAAPQITVTIPDTAPFSPEQRSWLSGFFSASVAAMAAEGPPTASNDSAATTVDGPILATNDEAPWHDPSMEPDARMEMAKDRPIAPRLMAAMAQQDCGQCGYNCADYANAIFLHNEERLNLCAPGGKVTARLLKGLAVELNDINGDKTAADVGAAEGGKSRAVESAQADVIPGTSREAPATAVFKSRRRLNQEGSAKDTWHVEFDLSQSGVSYVVGDSFGVFPKNNQGLVDQIIAMLGASHLTEIAGKTLRQVLREDVDLGLAPDSLFELFSYISGGKSREKARALAKGEDPDGDAAQLDVLAVLHKFPNVRPHPEAFVDALSPLQPRLYSISSSPNLNLGGLSLTVDAVRYQINKRKRTGVASTWLADSVEPGEALKVYVQKAHNFALPDDKAKPVIMVGPGTGVAPFRAFLQERKASQAPGRNWLFFGHQKSATDFFYREELEEMRKEGVLSRLSLAWSRDAGQKFYVQDRMREVGTDLWRWLEDGAHVYVCGDAKRMAKDVEAALVDIAATAGNKTTDEAVAFVSQLKKDKRFQLDVY
ncbi:sulfite reductase subunit alpha [Lichenibacterium ramalinae]|uniref:assimilatory sulfite reductase (NADPH) n=1 Tax=Lichenibacterium ramalinae TaxID=2316527 RepID=A0A4Q2RD39_9HYPH|nr:sulfite reductase subunit alpha [Lichenibacterium ramalinae]RYB04184.1 sulfite reductase subunit alpha [Lichenibacterium ramalinae]